MEEYLEFAKEIAYKAKEIMFKYFNSDNESSYKFDQTIVTKADIEINEYLIQRVKEQYPEHSVDGEESQFGNSNYVWVCDPIDGTAMYARGVPVAVFSLALVLDGEPILGVIYDVFTNNLYSAIKGKGSYKNEVRIHVSDINLDDMRSVAHFDMYPGWKYNIYGVIEELAKKSYFASIGSVTHACILVASGEFNLVIFAGTEHKNCDIAAAKIIVEEAGGKVTDLFGNEQRYDKDINGAVVSNGVVHQEAIDTLKKYIKIDN